MTDPTVLKYRVTVAEAIQFSLEEREDDEMLGWPDDYLKSQVAVMDATKTSLNAAMAALSVLDEVYYSEKQERQAAQAKSVISQLVKEGLKLIKVRQDVVSDLVRARENVAAAASRIKRERVITQWPGLQIRVQAMDTSLSDLEQAQPEGERKIEALLEKFKMLSTQVDELLKDMSSIYQDAVVSGMGDEAGDIDTKTQELKFRRTSANNALQALREQSNMSSYTGQKNKLVDLINPTFSGAISQTSLDLYTFWTEFKEYADAKNLSNEDRVTLLKKVSLVGSPRALVHHADSLDDIWKTLKSSYGDPLELISAKAADIRKAGKCDGNYNKRREWLIDVHAKLSRLLSIAAEHHKQEDLYHSTLLGDIRELLPNTMVKDLRDKVKDWEEENQEEIDRPTMFALFLKFLQTTASEETFNIRFQSMTVGSDKPASSNKPVKVDNTVKQPTRQPAKKTYTASMPVNNKAQTRPPAGRPPPGKPAQWKPKPQAHQGGPRGTPQQRPRLPPLPSSAPYEEPKAILCGLCKAHHTHLFDCNNFQRINHQDRVGLAGWLRICHRCLRLDSRINFADKRTWWAQHRNSCVTDFTCEHGKCDQKDTDKQKHIVMCQYHAQENQARLEQFVTTLDQSTIIPNLRFFFCDNRNFLTQGEFIPAQEVEDNIVVDINENIPAIYMVQTIPGAKGADLFAFYDNGCSSASISTRGAKILCSTTCRPGPTVLNVAGGKRLTIPYGEERFNLPLHSGKSATMSGLQMDEITDVFPIWKLQQAWLDVQAGYVKAHPQGAGLPEVDDQVRVL